MTGCSKVISTQLVVLVVVVMVVVVVVVVVCAAGTCLVTDRSTLRDTPYIQQRPVTLRCTPT